MPEPVIWIIEYNSESKRQKIVLAWDFLHLIPRYSAEDSFTSGDRSIDYEGPILDTEQKDSSHQIVQHADLLVIEGNTFEPVPQSGHTSIDTGLKFTIPFLTPSTVWFVHYSGHEDPGGAVS